MSSLPRYCIAKTATPLLAKADFSPLEASSLPLDQQGLFRPLEMIAFPGTKFTILRELESKVLEVITQDYPGGPYYIGKSFVTFVDKSHPERKKILPPPSQILTSLENALGLPYIWGGNWREGVGTHFRGVDCSGLLYEATNGFTPRNTSQLLTFGQKVENLANVKRLDICVWPGHVIIFLSPTKIIESVHPQGVITRNAQERLNEISHNGYVIRRFTSKSFR